MRQMDQAIFFLSICMLGVNAISSTSVKICDVGFFSLRHTVQFKTQHSKTMKINWFVLYFFFLKNGWGNSTFWVTTFRGVG